MNFTSLQVTNENGQLLRIDPVAEKITAIKLIRAVTQEVFGFTAGLKESVDFVNNCKERKAVRGHGKQAMRDAVADAGYSYILAPEDEHIEF
jgi:hypothetical protein